VTPETKADYEKMIRPLLDFAQRQIREQGAFHPFAAKLTQGELVLVDAPFEGPTPHDKIEYLRKIFLAAATAGAIDACAIAYDGWISQPDGSGRTDAVIIECEHRGDEPADVSIPYGKSRLLGYRFGGWIKSHGAGHVFGPPAAS
jgi:hypothetical protein